MLSDREILNHVVEVVGFGARSQFALFVARKAATDAANVESAKANLRDSGCRITARVEKMILGELTRIETHARRFPNEVFYLLGRAAERKIYDPGAAALIGIEPIGMAEYYFTKRDRLGCRFFGDYAEGEQYQWFHNGVRIEIERALELVPLPDPESLIEIH